MSLGYWESLTTLNADGTALTAAARASLTQGAAATGARYTMPGNSLRIGDCIKILASGRISCAVTTPGTARFDLSFGGTANFDTLAMNLNIVAKTNVAWFLEVLGTVRAIGTTANIFWQGKWDSEAVIASPLPTVGGSGGFIVPYNTAPVIGPNFDSTVALLVDLQFAQTVATGSCTLHQYLLAKMTASGF
jgi:hypothetical protein